MAEKKSSAKKPAKKPVKKAKAKPKPKAAAAKVEKPIGRVSHYFDHIKVAVINLEKGKSLKVGDSIRVEGGELNFTQEIASLQVEHEDVKKVSAGDDFGTKVKKPVHEGYRVYQAK